jgi:hypothetical protein
MQSEGHPLQTPRAPAGLAERRAPSSSYPAPLAVTPPHLHLMSEIIDVSRPALPPMAGRSTAPGSVREDEVEQHLAGALMVLHLLTRDLRKHRSAFLPRVQEALGHVSEALRAQRAANEEAGCLGAPARPPSEPPSV